MPIDSDLVIIASSIMGLAGMAYSLVRRWIERTHTPPHELRAIDERLARIEQAVDAMAIEVERVSEGQRFAAKVLAERTGDPVGARLGGSA